MALPFDSGRTKGILAGNTALVLIILAALGIRTILFVSLRPWDDNVVERRVLTDDARSYHFLASSIVETGTFEQFDSGFYLRTPGYPLLIAGISSRYLRMKGVLFSIGISRRKESIISLSWVFSNRLCGSPQSSIFESVPFA